MKQSINQSINTLQLLDGWFADDAAGGGAGDGDHFEHNARR